MEVRWYTLNSECPRPSAAWTCLFLCKLGWISTIWWRHIWQYYSDLYYTHCFCFSQTLLLLTTSWPLSSSSVCTGSLGSLELLWFVSLCCRAAAQVGLLHTSSLTQRGGYERTPSSFHKSLTDNGRISHRILYDLHFKFHFWKTFLKDTLAIYPVGLILFPVLQKWIR